MGVQTNKKFVIFQKLVFIAVHHYFLFCKGARVSIPPNFLCCLGMSSRALFRCGFVSLNPHRHCFVRFTSQQKANAGYEKDYGGGFEPPLPTEEAIVRRSKNAQILKNFRDEHGDKLLVISGAGISTESGHPDYRSPKGAYSQGHQPATFQQFAHSSATIFRKRYWLRSYFGFPGFSQVPPNAAHHTLAQWERENLISSPMITQNVDRLHSTAGSQGVVELHGNLFEVVCLGCDFQVDRMVFQDWLLAANPFLPDLKNAPAPSPSASVRPDGDVSISDIDPEFMKVPSCPKCGGILKPNVVFFGESIPKARTNHTYDLVDNSSAVLCLGSSLQVFSAFRLVRRAKERGVPVVVVNMGETRADDLIDLKIEDSLGVLLPQV